MTSLPIGGIAGRVGVPFPDEPWAPCEKPFLSPLPLRVPSDAGPVPGAAGEPAVGSHVMMDPAASVAELEIGTRVSWVLKRAGCATLGDVLIKTPEFFLGMGNFGQVSLRELKSALAHVGHGYWGTPLSPREAHVAMGSAYRAGEKAAREAERRAIVRWLRREKAHDLAEKLEFEGPL